MRVGFNIGRAATLAAIAFAAGVWFLIDRLTSYGWTTFVAEPVFLGFTASALLAIGGPARPLVAFATAMLAGFMVAFAALIAGFEGAMCIFMSLPLVAPLVLLGACPQCTRIVEPRAGGRRVCTLTTGVLMERIDDWRPGERLSWQAVSTPPPMHELNPFHEVDAPHLHGTYRNIRGEFALERVGPRITRLTRRTWYSHDLYPSLYWTMWCDMGASKIQRFMLDEVRRAAETRRI